MSELNSDLPTDSDRNYNFLDDESDHIELSQYIINKIIVDIFAKASPTSKLGYRLISGIETELSRNKVEFPNNPNSSKSKTGKSKTAKSKTGKSNSGFIRKYSEGSFQKIDQADWDEAKEYFKKKLNNEFDFENSYIVKNIKLFGEAFGLSPQEQNAFLLLLVYKQSFVFSNMIDTIIENKYKNIGNLFSVILPDLSANDEKFYRNCFSLESDLSIKGIIQVSEIDDDDSDDDSPPTIPRYISELIYDRNLTIEQIRAEILGNAIIDTNLSVKDFPHMKDQIDRILLIVKGAIEQNEKGINILLYGPPGSGKTALAAAIAQELELAMYTVGEDNPDDEGYNGSNTAKYRISKLQQAHTMLKSSKSSIVFFDEIEDSLNKGTDSDKKADVFSKILLNRLLEKNPVVTIWAGNDLNKFHESVRQRFSYSLEVTHPPTLMREKIWLTQMKLNHVELSDQDVRQLARDFVAPPRMVAQSLKLARLTGQSDIDSIVDVIKQSSLISYEDEDALSVQSGLSRFYSRDLLSDSIRTDVLNYMESKGHSSKDSIFIHSKKGAGITALSEDIAESLIMHPMIISAENLSKDSMMQSAEDKIRSAFRSAFRGNLFLSITDIEQFNETPNNPKSEWRYNLVTAFVNAATRHGKPFIVSTTRPDLILPESLKVIFTLQSKMDYLTDEQTIKAGEIYFGQSFSLESLKGRKLLVADFASARRIAHKAAHADDPDFFRKLVLQQAEAREAHSQGHKVGF
jgi:SpoVK/Ycf46/Vps4 family AAA+-type ATPase